MEFEEIYAKLTEHQKMEFILSVTDIDAITEYFLLEKYENKDKLKEMLLEYLKKN
jgi:hypothetical protein